MGGDIVRHDRAACAVRAGFLHGAFQHHPPRTRRHACRSLTVVRAGAHRPAAGANSRLAGGGWLRPPSAQPVPQPRHQDGAHQHVVLAQRARGGRPRRRGRSSPAPAAELLAAVAPGSAFLPPVELRRLHLPELPSQARVQRLRRQPQGQHLRARAGRGSQARGAPSRRGPRRERIRSHSARIRFEPFPQGERSHAKSQP